jgi:hypothetical protein
MLSSSCGGGMRNKKRENVPASFCSFFRVVNFLQLLVPKAGASHIINSRRRKEARAPRTYPL